MKKLYFVLLLAIAYSATNAQSAWTLSSTGYNTSLTPYEIAIDGNNTLFASTVSYNSGTSTYSILLYSSTNAGTSWSQVTTSGLPNSMLNCMSIKGTNMYMGVINGGSFGIFKSTNAGATWTASFSGYNTSISPNKIAIDDNGHLFVTAIDYNPGTSSYYTRVYTSTNTGTSWTEITTSGLSTASSSGAQFACITAKGSNLYIGLSGGGIYKSTNAGVTWTAASTGYNTALGVEDMTIADNNDVYIMTTSFNGTNYKPEIYKSTNAGSSWSQLTLTGLTQVAGSCISAEGTNMYIGTQNGIYKSTDFTSSTTAVAKSISENISVNLYPNPATNSVSIPSEIVNVQVENAIGTAVLEQTSVHSTLDLSGITNGVYILKGFNSNGQLIFTERLVINKN